MTFKSTVSMVGLMLSLTSANVFAVRVNNPRIVKELNQFYAQMEAEGRTGELSKAAKSVCSCLKKGAELDQDALIHAIREAQSHGYMVRAYAHPSLIAKRQVNNQK